MKKDKIVSPFFGGWLHVGPLVVVVNPAISAVDEISHDFVEGLGFCHPCSRPKSSEEGCRVRLVFRVEDGLGDAGSGQLELDLDEVAVRLPLLLRGVVVPAVDEPGVPLLGNVGETD